MPIYETTMTVKEMQKAADDGHECAICHGPLSVAWDGKLRMRMLRCQDLSHDKITRHDFKREEWIKEHSMESKSLTKLTENQMMGRVAMGGKFIQDLNPVEKRTLAKLAVFYGFDPAMGEMTIYQGRPYISIDGRYRKAQETGLLNGVSSRPATEQERKSWDIPAGDFFFQAEVRVKGCDYPYVGWGRVRATETIGGKGFKPIETNPQRMAEKRAEAQALRKAFHIDLPGIEDIGTEDDAQRINEAKDVTQTESKEQVSSAGHVTKPTLGDALNWCQSHNQGKKWFLDNCGFKEQELIDEPVKVENAIQNICAFTGWKYERK